MQPVPSKQTAASRPKRLSRTRRGIAAAAVLLIALAWWQVLAAGRGLDVRNLSGEDGTPLRYLVLEGATDAPGIVIAHGFAGSKQLMTGFAHAFAHAGYGVMLLDFDGHGAAGGRLDRGGDSLARNLASAYDRLVAQPEVDPARVAILGHSMGSGAAMQAAIESPDRYRATIAVSPTSAAVTPDAPPNLLLLAGALEPQFLGNARRLLAAAGGETDDLSAGRGRALVVAPGVEHITILFSRVAHQASVDWANRALGLPDARVAADRRMVFFAAGLAGWLVLLAAISPLLVAEPELATGRARRPRLGLLVGVLGAIGLTYLIGMVTNLSTLGGLLVGGALGLWFAVAGLMWLGVGFHPPRITTGALLWGVGLFAFLSLAFGAMAQLVWLPWILTPERLARWPLLALAGLPFFLASALATHRAGPAARLGWWAAQSAAVVAGLGLTILLIPDLFFIFLLLPIFPIVLAILGVVGAAVDRPWSVALASALFFGWLLVAVFPMA